MNSGMQAADTVFRNGTIYTVDPSNSWAESVAIKNGRFIAVGTHKDVEKLIGDNTLVKDLNGKFVMPGIHDVHLHPDVVVDYRVNLEFFSELAWPAMQEAIKSYAAHNKNRRCTAIHLRDSLYYFIWFP